MFTKLSTCFIQINIVVAIALVIIWIIEKIHLLELKYNEIKGKIANIELYAVNNEKTMQTKLNDLTKFAHSLELQNNKKIDELEETIKQIIETSDEILNDVTNQAQEKLNIAMEYIKVHDVVTQEKFGRIEGKIQKDIDIFAKELHNANQNLTQLFNLISSMCDDTNDDNMSDGSVNDGGKLRIESLS